MAENKQLTTAVSQWSTQITGLVARDYEAIGLQMDDYSKSCAMSAISSIFDLVNSQGESLNNVDISNLRQTVGQMASLKLSATNYPPECYFQLRKKKVGNTWAQAIEAGIMGAGNDRILSTFGENVERVYPAWVIHEGDDFVPPKFKGIEVAPPEWTPNNVSDRVAKVCYLIKLTDGTMQYLVSERESAKINLIAHIRNNMLNETFGIAESRYKATDAQKAEIAKKKAEIMDKVKACATLDEIIALPEAQPYMSAAWLDSTESMVERKLRNNCVKKFPKNFDAISKRSFTQLDDTYVQAQDDISEEENSEAFETAMNEVN